MYAALEYSELSEMGAYIKVTNKPPSLEHEDNELVVIELLSLSVSNVWCEWYNLHDRCYETCDQESKALQCLANESKWKWQQKDILKTWKKVMGCSIGRYDIYDWLLS